MSNDMNSIYFQSSGIFDRVVLGITFCTEYCWAKYTKKMRPDNLTTKAKFQKLEKPFLKWEVWSRVSMILSDLSFQSLI